jgi:hypothetical protein
MEPRAYVPAPSGINFAQVSFVQSSGGVAVDPSLPLDNIEARVNAAALGYLRTFSMFGHAASIGGGLPYVWGKFEGDVFETHREATRSVSETRAARRQPARRSGARSQAVPPRRPGAGRQPIVVAPTGQYDPSHLINVGSNCWAVNLRSATSRWAPGRSSSRAAWFFQTTRFL